MQSFDFMDARTDRLGYLALAKLSWLAAILLGGWLLLLPTCVFAGDAPPLKPIDTSSPRATLQGFLDFMNKGYEVGFGNLQTYLASSDLYPSTETADNFTTSSRLVESAQRGMDLSGLPPAMVRLSSKRLAVQLKEILDRVDLPPVESIPDASAMAAAEFKRWDIPNSEIRIERQMNGPRAGEYLFSAETVARIPEFYAKVKDLPYKPGASSGWFEYSFHKPVGVAVALRHLVPPRWILDAPDWANRLILDQPLWRWLGIALVLGAGFSAVKMLWRLHRRLDRNTVHVNNWADLLRPASLVIVTPPVEAILSEALRVSGTAYEVLTLSLWSLFYLSFTWLVWVAGGAAAESVIAVERLRAASIDGQLIRLVLRLVTIVASVGILVKGADQVGLPAYSVMAGLGVGGLAVALAGQQTLANLIGSLIIMIEKPFAVGHWVKIDDTEGVVEDVGFRSTRIRTFYNSLITFPSSKLVDSKVDNMEMRNFRRVKTVLGLCYDTPPAKIEAFVQGVRQILQNNPHTRKDLMHVRFNEFSASSLDVMLYFFLKASNWAEELEERERIFLEILRLAESLEVRFAFPTQTLHIESIPEQRPASKTADVG